MNIYIFLYLFLLLGVFIHPKKQSFYLVLSFVLMFLVSAFRDISVGTDTVSYEWLFSRVKNGYVLHRQEIGWYYLNKLVVVLGGSFNWILLISTLLVLTPIFLAVKKYSLNPMLSIFLFYAFYIYLQSFNITRQIIAVSIAFYSLPFILSRKKTNFFIGILLSFLFHTTAIFNVIYLFTRRIIYHRLWWSIIVILSLIIGIAVSAIILPKIASILGYAHYLDKFESTEETGLFLIITNIFALFLIVTSSKDSVYLKLFFIYIVFYNLIANVPFAYRIVFFFSITQLLFLPYYIYNNKLKHRHVAQLIIILYASMFFVRAYGTAGILPYLSIFKV